jgi:glucose/arabinose dehydrogenase
VAHPGYEIINFRPAGFQPMVTGIGWMADGRMAVAHWGGTHAVIDKPQLTGKVYLISGAGGNSPGTVAPVQFADSLEDVMGMVVVNDHIFVSGGFRILELVDKDKDGKAEEKRVLFTLPGGPHARHEFLFGMLHKPGKFYVNASTAKCCGDDGQKNPWRGTTLEVDSATGKFEVISMGLRTPNGIGWGPAGEIFVPDVQGNWLPSCKLINVRKGRFYGFKHTPRETWDETPESPPAVYVPQGALGNAPGNPLFLTKGPFAGQMLMGDVSHGGIQRYFLETVKGEYQGAGFHFLGTLESGVERLAEGPDGMIYAGGIGELDGGWNWLGKLFGLQKLKPNGKTAFEMLAVRSLGAASMEIEFTEPLAAGAEVPANFFVESWHYLPTSAYGGPQIAKSTLTVRGVTVSADRKHAFLDIAGLAEKKVVHFRLGAGIKNGAGKAIWQNEAWYTLNAFGPGTPVTIGPEASRAKRGSPRASAMRFRDGVWVADAVGGAGPARLLRDASGRLRVSEAALRP